MVKKSILIVICYILFTNIIFAQDSHIWTLNDCINFALSKNLQIKQKQNNYTIAVNNIKQSYLNILPNLNFSTGRSFNYGDKFNIYTGNYEQGFTTSDNFVLNSSFIIFNGFYNLNSIKKNKIVLLQKQNEQEIEKGNLTIEIILSYLNILYNNELLKAIHLDHETTKELYKKKKILVDAQKITQSSLTDIEAQLAKEEYNILNAENNLNLAYIDLYSLLNIELKDSFKISEPETNLLISEQINYDLNELIDFALNNNPQILNSMNQLQIAEKDLKLTKSNLYPTISIYGYLTTSYSSAYTTYDYNTTPQFVGTSPTNYVTQSGEQIIQNNYFYNSYVVGYNDQLQGNLYNYFGVNLAIPIFNKGIVYKNVQNSKLALENANYNVEIIKNKIIQIITKAYYDADLAQKKYLSAKKMYNAQKLSFENASLKYNLGSISFMDFKMSKNELSNAYSEVVQAKYNYFFKLLVINFYNGKRQFF